MAASRWRSATVAVALVLVTLVVRDAFASSTTTAVQGNAISQVKIVRRTQSDCPEPCTSGPEALMSQTWSDLPGATTSITVPPNTQAIIDVRFSGAGYCTNNHTTCLFRVMIGGIDAYPRPDKIKYQAPNFPYADTGCLGNNSRCYMERSRGPLGPGTYTVQVQYRNAWVLSPPNDGQSGAFDWWNLTVERIDA